MGTYTRGTWPLALFVLFANPLLAQDKDPLKMVYAVWKDIGGAAYSVAQMNKKNYDKVEAWAVIVKDSTGKVEVTQRHNKAGGSDRAMQASVIIDTAHQAHVPSLDPRTWRRQTPASDLSPDADGRAVSCESVRVSVG